jgi:hypothetical protein
MISLLVFALFQLTLLVIDWLRRSRIARIVALLGALVQLWWAQSFPHPVARDLVNLPPNERVRTWRSGDTTPVPDYVSGVLTMEQAMERSIDGKSYDRLMGLSTLLWLGLTPVMGKRSEGNVPSQEWGRFK